MNNSNEWQSKFKTIYKILSNGNQSVNLLEHIDDIGEFNKVYTAKVFMSECPTATYAIKNIGNSNVIDAYNANIYVDDPSYNIVMIVYCEDILPTLFYEYKHVTANKGIASYCFYDEKKNKIIDLKEFPYKTDIQLEYLQQLDIVLMNYSGKNCRLTMTENPDTSYPSPKDTIYCEELFKKYENDYNNIINISKKYYKYSYAYNYKDIFKIFTDDNVDELIKLFPDTTKMINGRPILALAIDAGAENIFNYFVKKEYDPNQNDMEYNISIFHHAIATIKKEDKAFEFVKSIYNENIDVNNPDINGETCIIDAIKKNNDEIFDFFFNNDRVDLNVYSTLVTPVGDYKINLLYHAVIAKNEYALKKLLNRIDINEKDNNYIDLLTFALILYCENFDVKSEKIISKLLDNGISIPATINYYNVLPNIRNYNELYNAYSIPITIQNMIEEKRI